MRPTGLEFIPSKISNGISLSLFIHSAAIAGLIALPHLHPEMWPEGDLAVSDNDQIEFTAYEAPRGQQTITPVVRAQAALPAPMPVEEVHEEPAILPAPEPRQVELVNDAAAEEARAAELAVAEAERLQAEREQQRVRQEAEELAAERERVQAEAERAAALAAAEAEEREQARLETEQLKQEIEAARLARAEAEAERLQAEADRDRARQEAEELAAERERVQAEAERAAALAAAERAEAEERAAVAARAAQQQRQQQQAQADLPYGLPSGTRSHLDLAQRPGNRPPNYPSIARQKGWQGQVVLAYFVTSDGRVDRLRVVKSSGYEMLDQEALRAISAFRYHPGQAGWTSHPVSFSLKGDAEPIPARLRTSSN